MDLQLTSTSPHTVEILPTLWDEDTPCITLVYDRVIDHRSPALTPEEARQFGRQLIAAADAPPIVPDHARGSGRRHLRSVDSLDVEAIVDDAIYKELAVAMAEYVIDGRHVHNLETDEVIDATLITDHDRQAAITAYAKFILARMGRR